MSGIAAVLAELGVDVRGSDLKASRYTRLLTEAGVPVTVGHDAANLGDAALVVTSTAIGEANPELRAARAAGLPVLRRAEMLARVMELRRGIAVAGTHGKTTTSSMISHVLHKAGMDPTFLVGGELNDIGSNAGVGKGEWLVAEADESDGSLLFLRPEVAIVANVELDHHANYGCLDDVHDVFRRFVALLPEDGLLVLVAGSGGEELAAYTPARVVVVGLEIRRPARGGRARRRSRQRLHRPRRRRRGPRARGAQGAGRAQRPQRPDGAGRAAARRRDAGGSGAAPAHVQRRRPSLPVHRRARRRPRRRRLRPPSHGDRRDAHRRHEGRPRARDRRLPAAPVLAHPVPAARVRPRAHARRRGDRDRDLPGARGARARRERQAHRRRVPRGAPRRARSRSCRV